MRRTRIPIRFPSRIPLRAAFVLTTAILGSSLALSMGGCDQLNRPIGSPSSSSSSGGSTSTTSGDGGTGEGGLAPAPSFTAQPGDIQI